MPDPDSYPTMSAAERKARRWYAQHISATGYPIQEPPYHGTPEDAAWPGGLTHWTAVKAPGG